MIEICQSPRPEIFSGGSAARQRGKGLEIKMECDHSLLLKVLLVQHLLLIQIDPERHILCKRHPLLQGHLQIVGALSERIGEIGCEKVGLPSVREVGQNPERPSRPGAIVRAETGAVSSFHLGEKVKELVAKEGRLQRGAAADIQLEVAAKSAAV